MNARPLTSGKLSFAWIVLVCGALSATTALGAADTVVVYVALDEMYSQPILEAFAKRTGTEVKAVFDTEAAKTTGLVNRLIAERNRPRADVFWNNEAAYSVVLKKKGVLDVYRSPAAEAIPAAFKDPDGYWTGFAARARVIIYNTSLVSDPPKSILDLIEPEWKGKTAVANPLFGTAATHAAALFAAWGDDKAKAFYRDVRANGAAVLPGNAPVRDMVARGEYAWGITDTDDANGGVEDGFPVKWLLPDQEQGGLGVLVIPNSVALIKGGPNPKAGKALIDFLLSPEVEQRLSEMRSIQVPLNPAVKPPARVPVLSAIRAMDVKPEAMAEEMDAVAAFAKEEFLR